MNRVDQKSQTCQLEFDHFSMVASAVSNITVAPAKSLLYYFVPWVGAWVAWHSSLRLKDPLQTVHITEEVKSAAIKQVNALKKIAGIDRHITVYTSDGYSCTSFGGTCSFSAPGISIPRGFLSKPSETIFEGQPQVATPVAPHWSFTADEVLFFIAREVANIKSNNQLVRIAAKVFFVAALFFIYALSVPFVAGAGLMGVAVLLHLIAERCMKKRLDVDAVKLLKKYFHNEARAAAAGRSALQKLITQNVERREKNSLCRVYITKKGNNLLDLNHPFLTSRLDRINERFPIPRP